MDDNNVAGEGRLDGNAAVLASPLANAGSWNGLVRRSGDNAPIANAIVTFDGPQDKIVTTGTDGRARIQLLPGSYAYTVRRFGYQQASGSATITAGGTQSPTISLTQLATRTLSGTVTGPEGAASGARVMLVNTPLSTTTNASGQYSLTVPTGSYQISAAPNQSALIPSRCFLPVQDSVTVTFNTTKNLTLPARRDSSGYRCSSPTVGYQAGSTLLPITGPNGVAQVTLPFPITFYGQSYTTAWVYSDGVVTFVQPPWPPSYVGMVPEASDPNAAVYAFIENLDVDAAAGVYTSSSGSQFVIEWRNVKFEWPWEGQEGARLSISLIFGSDGKITLRYQNVSTGTMAAGAGAVIGIENATGTVGVQFANRQTVVASGVGVTFRTD